MAVDSLLSLGGNYTEDHSKGVVVNKEAETEQQHNDQQFCIVDMKLEVMDGRAGVQLPLLAIARPPFNVMLLVDTTPCSGRGECDGDNESQVIDDLPLRVVRAMHAQDGMRLLEARDRFNPRTTCVIRYDPHHNKGHLSFVGRPSPPFAHPREQKSATRSLFVRVRSSFWPGYCFFDSRH